MHIHYSDADGESSSTSPQIACTGVLQAGTARETEYTRYGSISALKIEGLGQCNITLKKILINYHILDVGTNIALITDIAMCTSTLEDAHESIIWTRRGLQLYLDSLVLIDLNSTMPLHLMGG